MTCARISVQLLGLLTIYFGLIRLISYMSDKIHFTWYKSLFCMYIILLDCIAWRRFCHFFYGFGWRSFWIPTFPMWNAFWYKNYCNSFKLKKMKIAFESFFFERKFLWACLPFPKPNTRWIIESWFFRLFGKQINKLHQWQMTPHWHAIIPAVKCFMLANINPRDNAATSYVYF